MQFGHFSPREIKEIGAVLNELGVPFSLEEDNEVLERQRQQRNRSTAAREMQPEIRYVWIDVADEDLHKVGEKLKGYGISAEVLNTPQFTSTEDYVCPRCQFSSPEPGLCPEHSAPLIEYSEYMQAKRKEESQAVRKNFWIVIPILLVIGYFVYRALQTGH